MSPKQPERRGVVPMEQRRTLRAPLQNSSIQLD
jgi:hypothetical protein